MLYRGRVIIIRWRQKVDGKEHEQAKGQTEAKAKA
jgi:hypothetical protein